MPGTHPDWKPRESILTEADIVKITQLLANHPCKFPNVTHEQMDKIVRMSDFFQKIEDKVVGGISWAFIAVIGGILYLFYNHGLLVKK